MQWTPESLNAYARERYRVRAGAGLPMVVLRIDGWQVGMRWCLTTDEACEELNRREAKPITSERFMRNGNEPDMLDMEGGTHE